MVGVLHGITFKSSGHYMSVSVEITFPSAPVPPPVTRYVGWRGLHVAEGGRVPEPLGSPGVIPPYAPTVKLEMTEAIQWLGYDLMAHFHPAVKADPEKYSIMHGWNVMMCNRTGFYQPDSPKRDYVNRRDLTSPLPEYDKAQRTCAGSFITGRVEGNLIWCEPGKDAIDARGFVYNCGTPEADAMLKKIIDNAWYLYAIGETAQGPYKIRGQWIPDGIIVFPFILDRPVSFERRFFAPWDETYLPDPLKVYTPI